MRPLIKQKLWKRIRDPRLRIDRIDVYVWCNIHLQFLEDILQFHLHTSANKNLLR